MIYKKTIYFLEWYKFGSKVVINDIGLIRKLVIIVRLNVHTKTKQN